MSAWITSIRDIMSKVQAKTCLQPDRSLVDEIAAAHLDLARIEWVVSEVAADRRFGDGRRDAWRDTEIEAVRNQKIGRELGGVDQLGDGARGGDLHRVVDAARLDVERAAEDPGKRQ